MLRKSRNYYDRYGQRNLNRMNIRKCLYSDIGKMFEIINAAAEAYRGIIPEDRWQEPYMPVEELEAEISDGVGFWGCEQDGELLGIMGMQDKGDVTLIRHAYVQPEAQRKGIGALLLRYLEHLTDKPVLIGTWADAEWAITFYEKNGYILMSHNEKNRLLRKYWSIPVRQVETSVVLAMETRRSK
jgi:GNAT superfamily N-acetyltransferase